MSRALLLLFLGGCAWRLGPPAVVHADQAAVLPLVHPSTDSRRWYVPLEQGGRTWLLFVDTGYSYTTCDDDFVRALGVPQRGDKLVRGELGNVRTSKAILPPIEVGEHRLEGLVCLVRDLGATSSIDDPREVPIAGVLGIDALRPFRVELDPGLSEIRLIDPDTVPPIGPDDPDAVRLRREGGFGTRALVPVDIGGVEARPILDSGASNTYVDGARLGLNPTWVDADVKVRGTGPAGETTIERAYFDIAALGIGPHTVGPLTLTDRPRGPGAPGLLGLDVLDRFVVELDFNTGMARFTPIAETPKRPGFNRWRKLEQDAPMRVSGASPSPR